MRVGRDTCCTARLFAIVSDRIGKTGSLQTDGELRNAIFAVVAFGRFFRKPGVCALPVRQTQNRTSKSNTIIRD
jgi:hypothetical protein